MKKIEQVNSAVEKIYEMPDTNTNLVLFKLHKLTDKILSMEKSILFCSDKIENHGISYL